jgi:hypothetical protein
VAWVVAGWGWAALLVAHSVDFLALLALLALLVWVACTAAAVAAVG